MAAVIISRGMTLAKICIGEHTKDQLLSESAKYLIRVNAIDFKNNSLVPIWKVLLWIWVTHLLPAIFIYQKNVIQKMQLGSSIKSYMLYLLCE